jgi:hypothetical protein
MTPFSRQIRSNMVSPPPGLNLMVNYLPSSVRTSSDSRTGERLLPKPGTPPGRWLKEPPSPPDSAAVDKPTSDRPPGDGDAQALTAAGITDGRVSSEQAAIPVLHRRAIGCRTPGVSATRAVPNHRDSCASGIQGPNRRASFADRRLVSASDSPGRRCRVLHLSGPTGVTGPATTGLAVAERGHSQRP